MSGIGPAALALNFDVPAALTCEDALKSLDDVHDLFLGGHILDAMRGLVPMLYTLRKKVHASEWGVFKCNWKHHPAAGFVLEDPFTSWSRKKPRGYPGDATLIDFIYGHQHISGQLDTASERGRRVFEYTHAAPAPVAVRERRDFMTNLVDSVAWDRGRKIDVLSIAAGHLREAATSKALQAGKIARWIALDQDAESLSNIECHSSVQPFRGSVRAILGRKYALGCFDVIYSAGLYDYLTLRVAKRLTETAFSMLKPGGTLLYANFAPDIPDIGYMETFMDWHLVLRSESQMELIWEDLPVSDVASRRLYRGANNNIIYAEVQRT